MNDFLRRYSLASYVVALMFIVFAFVDAGTNAWEWHFDSEQWRFGSTAIASGYFVTILFGLLLLAAIGVARRSRGGLLFVAVVSGVLTLGLLIGSISFVLDTFQVRSLVRDEQYEMFRIGAFKTGFKLVASLVGTLALTFGSFKAARDAKENATPAVLLRPN